MPLGETFFLVPSTESGVCAFSLQPPQKNKCETCGQKSAKIGLGWHYDFLSLSLLCYMLLLLQFVVDGRMIREGCLFDGLDKWELLTRSLLATPGLHFLYCLRES
jgi:hypothetical protein